MEENKTTTETNVPAIVPEDSANDAEAKIAALETEKAQLVTERDNYKQAYLKSVKKDGSGNPEETDEERTRRIVKEENMNSRISDIDKEKETLLQKTLKENKELKHALSNKPSETPVNNSGNDNNAVKSTVITPEQLRHFKDVLKWTDKDIERYKKSISKTGGR